LHQKSKRLVGMKVLVTGACGTIGKAIVRELASGDLYAPDEIVGLDNNESDLFLQEESHREFPNFSFFVADIRDKFELLQHMNGVDIVIHTAALKHVELNERSPNQTIQTNVVGLQNVIEAALATNVKKVIFTSSDKAVNPTNVMGTTKLLGERLFTAANASQRQHDTIFASTRFGNVLGSRGSVIPVFQRQIARGGPITLTHQEMTRFVMDPSSAVRLVLDSIELARGGEVFITKMPVMGINSLAHAMIELAKTDNPALPDINIEEVGVKPGEKLYEELMNSEEMRRSIELEDYFVVIPAFRNIYSETEFQYEGLVRESVKEPYVSHMDNSMSVEETIRFLADRDILKKSDT